MIRRRYPSTEFILRMPAAAAFSYLGKLDAAVLDEKLFLRWIVGPQFTMSFDAFRTSLRPADDGRSDADILSDTAKIFARAEGKES